MNHILKPNYVITNTILISAILYVVLFKFMKKGYMYVIENFFHETLILTNLSLQFVILIFKIYDQYK